MTTSLFHIVELVRREDHETAKDQKPGAEGELHVVTVKLVAESGEDAKRIALERYPGYVVLRHTARPTDQEPDEAR